MSNLRVVTLSGSTANPKTGATNVAEVTAQPNTGNSWKVGHISVSAPGYQYGGMAAYVSIGQSQTDRFVICGTETGWCDSADGQALYLTPDNQLIITWIWSPTANFFQGVSLLRAWVLVLEDAI